MSTEAHKVIVGSGTRSAGIRASVSRPISGVPASHYNQNLEIFIFIPYPSGRLASFKHNGPLSAALIIAGRPAQGAPCRVCRLSELPKLQRAQSTTPKLRRPCPSYKGGESWPCCGICSHVSTQSSTRRYCALEKLSSSSLTMPSSRPNSSFGRSDCYTILHLSSTRCNASFTYRPKNTPRPSTNLFPDDVYGLSPWTACQYRGPRIRRLARSRRSLT